ncbi:MAG: GTPase HflX [Gammaproteobacteria bacterium]|nr:GTPase HflX [Gammaproteobacteria bacterium]|tara:strand:+ start:3892 stop:5208 length:1317 start_codon:yes stop_codon:yes gene_type:complete
MHIVESNKIQNALLVFIEVKSLVEDRKLEKDYEEFCSLVSSCDVKIQEKIKLNQKTPSIKTFLSNGKLENIKAIVIKNDIDLIIINHKLSASQNRNLETLLNKRVIDKTELILDIFASRASSHIGKLQVELAQLNHLATRLIRGWTHLERQKGGIGLRGPGETQLETDRRLIGGRIKKLNQRLEKAHRQRQVNRYSRKKSRNKLVALVGYTNAGKTTLFNKLTESNQIAEDKLFATLDSVTRKNKNPAHGPILFSDTVGFISNLPTQLIESFKATLDELQSADLLLHVVDISDEDYKVKISEVNKILEDLELSDIPQIVVNNKCDLIQGSKLQSLKTRKDNEVFISAEIQELFTDLRSKINNQLFNGIYEGWISLENNLGNIRSILFDMGCVEEEKVSSCGKMFANIKIGQEELNQFINLKGFELCRDEDILFKSIKS